MSRPTPLTLSSVATLLLIIIHGVIYGFLHISDQVPSTPDSTAQRSFGVDLEEAFRDLQTIAARPRPYNSHANDLARDYILNRVQKIAGIYPHVHVDDDLQTTASFIDGTHAAYFEGSNILVKVDGWEDSGEPSAILFSAHFDSVSTAPGVTDDGMSIVGLLQLISYLAKHRSRRTALFNLNNGEEDGLHGAQAFINHPWANLTEAFINFEGAGAGGRPLLFRATPSPSDSPGLLGYFARPYVTHPHANALTADAFARGVIRSETDFAVYAGPRPQASSISHHATDDINQNDPAEKPVKIHTYTGPGLGLPGADVAFYKNRARYHTPDDTIWSMGGDGEGARRALWAIMEIMRGAGSAILASELETSSRRAGGQAEKGEPVVYFELFASYLVILSRSTVLKIYVAVLVAGPIALLAYAILVGRMRHLKATGTPAGEHVTDSLIHADESQASAGRSTRLRSGIGRLWLHTAEYAWFWLALLVGTVAQIALVTAYIKINPYIIHSRPLPVVLSTLSLSFLVVVLLFSFSASTAPTAQAHKTLFGLYVFTWLLLLGAAILMHKASILGLCWTAVWNLCVGLGLIISSGEQALERSDSSAVAHGGAENTLTVECNMAAALTTPAEEIEQASETTPLIARPPAPSGRTSRANSHSHALRTSSKVLVTVPAPVILFGTIMFLWVGSMSQTAVDGGPAGVVYAPVALLSLFLVLPIAPFAHIVHRWLTYFVAIVFVASTAYAWVTFPFDNDGGKLKVFWSQRVELGNLTASANLSPSHAFHSGELRAQKAITQLTAVPVYVERVSQELPSSWSGEDMNCEDGVIRPGLRTCSWAVDRAFFPNPIQPSKRDIEAQKSDDIWIHANATRLDASSARFEISGTNTRACRLYIDNRRVLRYRVLSMNTASGDGHWQEHEIPKGSNIVEMRLWSRTWGRRFVVEVWWAKDVSGSSDTSAQEDAVHGRVACEWAEYSGPWSKSSLNLLHRSNRQDEEDSQESERRSDGARIPALEETLMFMPPWATLSKAGDGLVEAVAGFMI